MYFRRQRRMRRELKELKRQQKIVARKTITMPAKRI
jgi:ribosomal protein L19E